MNDQFWKTLQENPALKHAFVDAVISRPNNSSKSTSPEEKLKKLCIKHDSDDNPLLSDIDKLIKGEIEIEEIEPLILEVVESKNKNVDLIKLLLDHNGGINFEDLTPVEFAEPLFEKYEKYKDDEKSLQDLDIILNYFKKSKEMLSALLRVPSQSFDLLKKWEINPNEKILDFEEDEDGRGLYRYPIEYYLENARFNNIEKHPFNSNILKLLIPPSLEGKKLQEIKDVVEKLFNEMIQSNFKFGFKLKTNTRKKNLKYFISIVSEVDLLKLKLPKDFVVSSKSLGDEDDEKCVEELNKL
jgi:hypothetical protein